MKNIHFFALCAFAGVIGSVQAQTVTVDGTTSAAPTAYPTITDAVNSFAAGGPNNGNPALPNVINITTFGPFDEVLPIFGAGTAAGVTDGTEGFTIQGSGVKPLILARDTGFSGASWVVNGGITVTLNNLITAQSPTLVGDDDFFFVINNDTVLNTEDVVITALPTGSTAYTSINDIPADLLDGSRAFDSTLIASGDNGMFVGLSNQTAQSDFNATNTIVTQQGRGTTPDGIVNFVMGNIVLGQDCLVSNNARFGIQMASTSADLEIAGSLENPVCIVGHSVNAAIRTFSARKQVANHLLMNNNLNGVICSRSVLTPHSYTNSIFSNNGVAIDLADGGDDTVNGTQITNCTFYNNEVGLIDDVTSGAVVPVSVLDSIIAGPGGTGIAVRDIETSNWTVTNSALVTAGPDALAVAVEIRDAGALPPTETNVINSDPQFTSTAFSKNRLAPDFFLAVGSSAYATADSTGGPLTGGGVYAPSSVNLWELY